VPGDVRHPASDDVQHDVQRGLAVPGWHVLGRRSRSLLHCLCCQRGLCLRRGPWAFSARRPLAAAIASAANQTGAAHRRRSWAGTDYEPSARRENSAARAAWRGYATRRGAQFLRQGTGPASGPAPPAPAPDRRGFAGKKPAAMPSGCQKMPHEASSDF
jgi:hypothetical protein